uniref:MD-2-related lipid-recognition domain-containing protein n=1 Tax=Alexandrium andersonii TaxID=327968 RepID=A0A7S2IFL7_9DINO|mmetsp:Transcript_82737/g.184751  ORF Transcript_82737/g.184751 Transcript_82737/m.184751 type:complete len:232 (+) Transcript_82737:56-751(+)
MVPKLLSAVSCLAAALPLGAWGLRMSASGPPASKRSLTLPVNWTRVVEDAMSAPLTKGDKGSTNQEDHGKVEPGMMDLEWEIKDLEEGANVSLYWDHGCDGKGKPIGKCTFDRADRENPSGFNIVVDRPLNSTEKVEFSTTVKVLFFPVTKRMECPICDGTCTMETPGDMENVQLEMPECPVPVESFSFALPPMDFSTFPPPSMRVNVKSNTKITRADGSTICDVAMTVSM